MNALVEPNQLGRVRALWGLLVDLLLTHAVALCTNTSRPDLPRRAESARIFGVRAALATMWID